MTGESCALLAVHGIPVVVHQAQSDKHLSKTEKEIMWFLRDKLDFILFTPQYSASVASGVGCRDQSATRAMRRLIAKGYLIAGPEKRPLSLRFPWSRRPPHLARVP